MPVSDESLVRFVRRVHRRLVVVRALERAGACVGVAAVFACAFACVALIQGREAMVLVLPMLAIGAGIGVAWGLLRRPTRFDAATEADRQLRLSDLLATAYSQRDSDDPWCGAVIAIADQRCRALAPASVVVHRFGGRAWGSIGLAAATGLTLALLSGVPQQSRARPAAGASAAIDTAAEREVHHEAAGRSSAPQDTRRPSPASAGHAKRGGETGLQPAEEASDAEATPRLTSPGDAAAGGERSGQTQASSGEAVAPPTATGRDSTQGTTATAGGGSGQASPGAEGTDAASPSRVTAAQRPGNSPPPWSSPTWDQDRARVGEAVRSGRVPDAYRDVVREYFGPGGDGESR